MNWYLAALKKYAEFGGRARRKEYWFFVLFNFLINIGLAVVDRAAGTLSGETGIGMLSAIYTLAILIPNFAVLCRRLHDTGRSGWWFWIGLIPVIGQIILLVFLVSGSAPEENRYGPSPKLAD